MNISITGSSGLIGRALSTSLRNDGHRVVGIVRHQPSGADEIRWDPAAGQLEPADLAGVDAVVHLAGEGIAEKRWTDAQKRQIEQSRVLGTDLIARTLAASDDGPRILVSGSAIGYYGNRGDESLTEESDAGTGFLAGVCEKWEAATLPASAAGVRVAIARTGIVLDAGGGVLKKQLPLFRLGVGGRVGSGHQYMSWISLADEVRALRWLIDNDIEGPVNLTAPEPVTNRAFSAALGRAVHRPSVVPIPPFGPKLIFGSELVDELLLASQRVIPARLTTGGFAFEHATLDTALAAAVHASDD